MRTPAVQLLITGLVLAAAVFLRIVDPEPVARLRLSIFDTYQRWAPREAPPSLPVRVIDIDEASLERIGQWPWPRTRLAELVDRAREAGARTVALDLILAEPDRLSPEAVARTFAATPDLAPLAERAARLATHDEQLAVALARLPSVIGVSGEMRGGGEPPAPRAAFAVAGDDPMDYAPRFPGATGPLPALAARASGLGAVNWLPASDQIVRRVPLIVTLAGKLYPSLALEVLRLAEKETTVFVRSSGGSGIEAFGQKAGIDSLRVGGVEVPTDGDGEMWIRFRHFDPKLNIPAYRVIDGSVDPAELKDRHILIGASATGLLDLRATPLDASVPGVEIHAQALEQLISGAHLERPAWATGAEILFLVIAGAGVGWLINRAGPVVAALIGGAAIGAVGLGSWLAFRQGFLFDPVYPALALVLLYLTGSLYTYVRTEAERARVRSAFSHYLAPPLVEALARNPEKLKLGGEMREVTVLFADVRGFSRLSEGMEAEELVRFVNALFTPLTEAILDSRGTIDKFMGDAVMAFWNAPVADPDHAANACRAALHMMARLEALNADWPADARPRTRAGERVRIGIGLNTGSCCVGNVGSPQRFDYSILGDVVNIASRLEEATKIYHTGIIVGESTMRAAPGLAFLELDAITLRGKSRPERIYALVGDERIGQSAAFDDLRVRHAALVAALAAGDRPLAEARLTAVREIAGASLAPLIDHYADRTTRART